MKKTLKRIVITASLVILIASFAGCSLLADILGLPLTIEQRITAFSASINAESRTAADILANFIPVTDMDYGVQAATDTFWDALFDPDSTFEFDVTDKGDTNAVEVTMTETSSGNELDPVYLTFNMYEEASGNWLIEEIWYSNGDNLIRGF
jgi:hypothetical protein